MTRYDTALLLLRVCVGLTILAHAYNHVFGGGKLPGTARWFESLGMRPGMRHAIASVVTEVAGGLGLVFGFLTPLSAAAVIGVMTVAGITAHRPNGFFIFKPGQGYEYVLMIGVVGFAIALLGPGRASLDHAFGIDDWATWARALIGGGAGLGGAALLLGTSWRPPRPEPATN